MKMKNKKQNGKVGKVTKSQISTKAQQTHSIAVCDIGFQQ